MDPLAKVRHTIERYGMLRQGMRIGVAVSGGADSMFLLLALREFAPHWDARLGVVHVEHGIRGDASLADAEFVRRQAAHLGLPFHLRSVQIPESEGNLEQAARQIRHAFFRDLIAEGAVDCVATGHTRSDQAETILYRLFRGAGLAGLQGILPITQEGLIRPLLDLDRAEVEAWLREHGAEWREDSTNQDVQFARNRLRSQILPELRQAFNPNLDGVLAHLAVLARDEEDYWERSILPRRQHLNSPFRVLRADELASQHPALARRTIRRAVSEVAGDLRRIDFTHVETVLEMARSPLGSGRTQLPGLDIFRSFSWIRIAPAGYDSGRPRDYQFPVTIPGSIVLPDHAGAVSFTLTEHQELAGGHAKVIDELDWQRLTFSFAPDAPGQGGAGSGQLELRNWRPGDQYRRTGETHERKIKDLFQEARVPLWERRHWPVLVSGARILWVKQFGCAAGFAAGPGTPTVLHVRENSFP